MATTFEQHVYRVVRGIPAGRVASYGTVAALAGRPRHARQVGRILSRLVEDSGVPWWRVVRAEGTIALPGHDHADRVQRALLESEGVGFTGGGRIVRRHFLGEGDAPARSPARRVRA